MSICDGKWKYINEGNVHIVLQISGTNRVIRLIKEEYKPLNLSVVTNSIDYVNKIMIPLLFGDDNHYYEEITTLTSSEILELSKDLDKWRPNHRKVKSKLSQYAITALNLTNISPNGENYCLEIKPKEGFIPKSLKKYSKCYYCLKQYLKMNNNEIKSISDYCPLDLFSGNTSRMKHALLSLTQNPQNNFKIFLNGTIIFGDAGNNISSIINQIFDSYNTFLDFIITILLCEKTNTMLKISNEVTKHTKLEACDERHDLINSSFLHKLLSIQQIADELDVNVDSDEKNFEYVTEVLKNLDAYGLNLAKSCDREKFLQVSSARDLALISAVAKDCSLMISFTLETDEKLPHIIVNGRAIYYRLSVTDLEPKSIKTLKKREDSRNKLLEAYEHYKNNHNL